VFPDIRDAGNNRRNFRHYLQACHPYIGTIAISGQSGNVMVIWQWICLSRACELRLHKRLSFGTQLVGAATFFAATRSADRGIEQFLAALQRPGRDSRRPACGT
jgi:hypothetical protein